MTEREYPVFVLPALEEDEGFVAFAIDLPGCLGDGATLEEAVLDLYSAIGEWIDEAKRLGREIPKPGAANRKVTKDRAAIEKLIKAQGSLIETQESLITDQRSELVRMREIISEILDDEALPGRWLAPPAHVAVSSKKRAKHLAS